jgi:hypothetical protein
MKQEENELIKREILEINETDLDNIQHQADKKMEKFLEIF